jgi:hypothetical protein
LEFEFFKNIIPCDILYMGPNGVKQDVCFFGAKGMHICTSLLPAEEFATTKQNKSATQLVYERYSSILWKNTSILGICGKNSFEYINPVL